MLVGLPDHGLTTCPIDRPRHEVLPAIAGGHGDEQSEQDDVGPDPRHQAVTALVDQIKRLVPDRRRLKRADNALTGTVQEGLESAP
jgi:hypothetical protein